MTKNWFIQSKIDFLYKKLVQPTKNRLINPKICLFNQKVDLFDQKLVHSIKNRFFE